MRSLSCTAALLSALLMACSSQEGAGCVVKGGVVDVQDGEPLVGVRVEGPSGARAVSDPRGRFTLSGLEEGTSGDLRAWRSDGWEAKVPLRPLEAGPLEVTLRLSPPRHGAHSSASE